MQQHEHLAANGEDDRGEGQESGQGSMSHHPDDCIVSFSARPHPSEGDSPPAATNLYAL